VKNYQHLGLLTGAAVALLNVQPSQAANIELTKAEKDSPKESIELSLKTDLTENNLITTQGEIETDLSIDESLTPELASDFNLTEESKDFNQISDSKLNFESETPELIAQNANPNTPTPDVLIPNPEIVIEGGPAPAVGTLEPVAPTPQFLPRAVAPPVGDIAISNIDASMSYLDLGTAARVPRLVLRDAPVREVLSLLGRAAGLNVVYTETGGDATTQASSTISLDLENEPVQDVFNSVLMVSSLQANRRGNTIFVGPQLPLAASNLISRTLRLNQVPVASVAVFLAGQGAQAQQLFTEEERLLIQLPTEGSPNYTKPPELVPLNENSEGDESGSRQPY
jgi:type IV pilus assembly protein PilQ